MENSKKIIAWSLKHSQELSLKVEYYTSMSKCFSKIYDIGIFITIFSVEYYGRGTDEIEEIAYCKALSEAIERASLKIYKIQTTNGFAIHPELNEAMKNAKHELLERDAFLCSYLLDLGFNEVDVNLSSHCKYFSDKGIEIKFYELSKYEESLGILCVANGEKHELPFGYVMGSSQGKNIQSAARGALIEVARALFHLMSLKTIETMNEEEFYQEKTVLFSHHGKLALNLEHSQKIKSFFSHKKDGPFVNAKCDNIRYEVLDLSLFPIPDLPLFLVKASSDAIQDLYTGPTTKENINFQRLNSIRPGVTILDINLVPHPFD